MAPANRPQGGKGTNQHAVKGTPKRQPAAPTAAAPTGADTAAATSADPFAEPRDGAPALADAVRARVDAADLTGAHARYADLLATSAEQERHVFIGAAHGRGSSTTRDALRDTALALGVEIDTNVDDHGRLHARVVDALAPEQAQARRDSRDASQAAAADRRNATRRASRGWDAPDELALPGDAHDGRIAIGDPCHASDGRDASDVHVAVDVEPGAPVRVELQGPADAPRKMVLLFGDATRRQLSGDETLTRRLEPVFVDGGRVGYAPSSRALGEHFDGFVSDGATAGTSAAGPGRSAPTRNGDGLFAAEVYERDGKAVGVSIDFMRRHHPNNFARLAR